MHGFSHLKNVIAIDGPAGSGKSTTARMVARKLGFTYLDTGALYRALTLVGMERQANLSDGEALAQITRDSIFKIESTNDGARVWVDGEEVTLAIRTPEVTKNVSLVSSHAAVRAEMVELQRRIAQGGGFVVEGRDIGTVVFPKAKTKIFLNASVEARARRRMKEMQAHNGQADFEEIKKAIETRDWKDSNREHAPLKKADDAHVVDTTALTIDEQVDRIIQVFSAAPK